MRSLAPPPPSLTARRSASPRLVVFGAAGTLEADATWRAYLQWLRRRRCFVPAGAPSIFGESREPAVTSVDAADSG